MQFSSLRHLSGLEERRFRFDDIPGILWTPPSSSATQRPIVLAGQPSGAIGMDQMYPRLVQRARLAAEAGLATTTIELPGGGGRPQPPGVNDARLELRQAIADGTAVTDHIIDRLVLPLVNQAVPEWRAVLDVLLDTPGLGGPVGYSGGVIAIGTRLAAVEPRLAAAALFAGSFIPRVTVEEARRVTVPVHVLLQWDDEHNDRHMALDLFDAFGSQEKTLSANLGGHTGIPQHAGEEANRFLVRHLKPTKP